MISYDSFFPNKTPQQPTHCFHWTQQLHTVKAQLHHSVADTQFCETKFAQKAKQLCHVVTLLTETPKQLTIGSGSHD